MPACPYAYGGPSSQGSIKSSPDDFKVTEQLAFQPEGLGEHVFLYVEKCGENTEYIAKLLARFAKVRLLDIGYTGLKDRHARTKQWFSVWLPGKDDPDWKQAETNHFKILNVLRHPKKLKRGLLFENNFQIIVREWQGDKEQMEKQLQILKEQGMPNYFGPQRFGHQGQNIHKALAFFQAKKVKRKQKGFYFSVARSYLFNQLLAKRISLNNWNKAVTGEVLMFNQSHSYFKADKIDETIEQRINAGEIHPTGLLYGKGQKEVALESLAIETEIINNNPLLATGLIENNLSASRRALRVLVNNLYWEFRTDATLFLSFSLPAGSYATALLREVVDS